MMHGSSKEYSGEHVVDKIRAIMETEEIEERKFYSQYELTQFFEKLAHLNIPTNEIFYHMDENELEPHKIHTKHEDITLTEETHPVSGVVRMRRWKGHYLDNGHKLTIAHYDELRLHNFLHWRQQDWRSTRGSCRENEVWNEDTGIRRTYHQLIGPRKTNQEEHPFPWCDNFFYQQSFRHPFWQNLNLPDFTRSFSVEWNTTTGHLDSWREDCGRLALCRRYDEHGHLSSCTTSNDQEIRVTFFVAGVKSTIVSRDLSLAEPEYKHTSLHPNGNVSHITRASHPNDLDHQAAKLVDFQLQFVVPSQSPETRLSTTYFREDGQQIRSKEELLNGRIQHKEIYNSKGILTYKEYFDGGTGLQHKERYDATSGKQLFHHCYDRNNKQVK